MDAFVVNAAFCQTEANDTNPIVAQLQKHEDKNFGEWDKPMLVSTTSIHAGTSSGTEYIASGTLKGVSGHTRKMVKPSIRIFGVNNDDKKATLQPVKT